MVKATKIKDLCLVNSLQHFRPVPKMIYGPRTDDLCDKTRVRALSLSTVCFEGSSGWALKSLCQLEFFLCAEPGYPSETPPGQGHQLPGHLWSLISPRFAVDVSVTSSLKTWELFISPRSFKIVHSTT